MDILVVFGVIAPLYTFSGVTDVKRGLDGAGFPATFVNKWIILNTVCGALIWSSIPLLLISQAKIVLGISKFVLGGVAVILACTFMLFLIQPIKRLIATSQIKDYRTQGMRDLQ